MIRSMLIDALALSLFLVGMAAWLAAISGTI